MESKPSADPNSPLPHEPASSESEASASAGVHVEFVSLLPSRFLGDVEFRRALGKSLHQTLSHYLKLVCEPDFAASVRGGLSYSPTADMPGNPLTPVRVEIRVLLPPGLRAKGD